MQRKFRYVIEAILFSCFLHLLIIGIGYIWFQAKKAYKPTITREFEPVVILQEEMVIGFVGNPILGISISLVMGIMVYLILRLWFVKKRK